MFGVGRAADVAVRIVIHKIAHPPSDREKVCYFPIMHEGVSAKDKRMVIHRRSSCSGCSTNMSEACFGCCVGTDAAEIPVI